MRFNLVTQKQFERFFEVLEERQVDAEKMSQARYNGELCRAAVEAGWMQLDVDEAGPRLVSERAREIRQFVQETLEVPAG
jgi:hypothetical protein